MAKKKSKLGKVSVYQNPQRGNWICDYTEIENGKPDPVRRRFSFQTRKQAEARKQKIENARRKTPENPILEAAKLSVGQSARLLSLHDLMNRTQLSFEEIEKAVLALVPAETGSISLSEAAEKYLEAKREGWSAITFGPERTRVRQFVREVGVEFLHEVTSDLIIRFLRNVPASYRAHLSVTIRSFLNFFSNPDVPESFYLRQSPWNAVEAYFAHRSDRSLKKAKERDTPTSLKIAEVRDALRIGIGLTINGKLCKDFLGSIVLGTFLGLRPYEIYNLFKSDNPWRDHIKLSQQILTITKEIAGKDTSARTVEIRPNVIKWLEFIRDFGYPLGYNKNSQKAREKHSLFRKTFLGDRHRDHDWNDVCRHTFGTMLYHSTSIQNPEQHVIEDEIVRQMGNSARVYAKHYKGALHEGDTSEAFWSIVPEDFGSFSEGGYQLKS